MDQLVENAIKGKYDGKPAKYVLLYNDLMEAGINYSYVSSFQMALFKGNLVSCINDYINESGVRP